MGRGEFEEILEECLSALLEGRRSVEESLSLYPAWRGRLEPLLRAAEETAAAFDQAPPSHASERGLERFLEVARIRGRLREMFPPRRVGTPWWRWAPAGLAAVISVLVFLSSTLIAEEGRTLGDRVVVRPYTPTPEATATVERAATVERTAPPASVQSPLERVQEQVAALEEAVRQGEPVEVGLLEELEEASSDLAESLKVPGKVGLMERMAAVSAASREYQLLQDLRERSSGSEEPALAASLAAAQDVLEKLGATPGAGPGASPSPEPTASTTATPSPSPAATPSPTPSPTRTPGPEQTPAPSPTPRE